MSALHSSELTGVQKHSARPRRVSFKTLGCKLNQAETESIATGFKSLGWEIADYRESVDAVIINTCTVTNTADRKSRSEMSHALRHGSDETLIVMTGCYANGHREELEADGRTYVVGNENKSSIPQLVDAYFKREIQSDFQEGGRTPFAYPVAKRVFRTRAMVKVQDGCDHFCTFCIIPFVRGRGISRSLEETVQAVEEAAASGYREIVLTGVNMSRWQEGEEGFTSLVEACLHAQGNFRLRLGSIEPDRLDNGLLDLMAHPKMTPHMHLCLQSGAERILKAMKRPYTAAWFESIAGELRRRIKSFNLTTDVIVGFPGETDNDFADTASMCERLGFGHIHTFPYSRRTGTRADRMPDQIPERVKKERSRLIRDISRRGKRVFRESMIGSMQEILVERTEWDREQLVARGLSANYVPVRFEVPGKKSPDEVQNRLFSVRVKSINQGDDPDLAGLCSQELC